MRIIFILLFAAAACGLRADDNVTQSHKGGFKIVQNYTDKDGWSETLHFNHSGQPDVFLDQIPWPGDYFISPDDRWILRIQKTGSGDNTAYLYFIEKNGSLWRMEQRLPDMGFDYLRGQPKDCLAECIIPESNLSPGTCPSTCSIFPFMRVVILALAVCSRT